MLIHAHHCQVVAELAQGEGVVLAGHKLQARALVSGLLLQLEALTVHGRLSREQGALLRNLAWQNDFALLKAYEGVSHNHHLLQIQPVQQSRTCWIFLLSITGNSANEHGMCA